VNYRGLNIPFTSFGNVTSDDLFCEKEQALFDLYEKWGTERRYSKALDIGANIGVHSILMARQGWEVWAFEPDPQHFGWLVDNAYATEVRRQILPYQAAVSDLPGRETFVRVKGNTTGSHLKGDKEPYGELEEFEVLVVDCRPLFSWADFAKIDCEGHEARLLLTVTPDICCEFMVEVGSLKNAEAIYSHFKGWRGMWSQQHAWGAVEGLGDMPIHHSHGALFIGKEKP
jgi:FkbM family methyltransferase